MIPVALTLPVRAPSDTESEIAQTCQVLADVMQQAL